MSKTTDRDYDYLEGCFPAREQETGNQEQPQVEEENQPPLVEGNPSLDRQEKSDKTVAEEEAAESKEQQPVVEAEVKEEELLANLSGYTLAKRIFEAQQPSQPSQISPEEAPREISVEEIEAKKTILSWRQTGWAKSLAAFGTSALVVGLAYSFYFFSTRKPEAKYAQKNIPSEDIPVLETNEDKDKQIGQLKTELAFKEEKEKDAFALPPKEIKTEIQPLEVNASASLPPAPTPAPVVRKRVSPPPPTPTPVVRKKVSPPPRPASSQPDYSSQSDWIALANLGSYNLAANASDASKASKPSKASNASSQPEVYSGSPRPQRQKIESNSLESSASSPTITQKDRQEESPIKFVSSKSSKTPKMVLRNWPAGFNPRPVPTHQEVWQSEINQSRGHFSPQLHTSVLSAPKAEEKIEEKIQEIHREQKTGNSSATPSPVRSLAVADEQKKQKLPVKKRKGDREEYHLLNQIPVSRIFIGTRAAAKLITPLYHVNGLVDILNQDNPEDEDNSQQPKFKNKFLVELQQDIVDTTGKPVIKKGGIIVFEVKDILSNGVLVLDSLTLLQDSQEFKIPPQVVSIRGKKGNYLLAREERLNRSEIFNRDILGFIVSAAVGVGEELTKPKSRSQIDIGSSSGVGTTSSSTTVEESRQSLTGAILKGAEPLAANLIARNIQRVNQLLNREKLWVINQNAEVQIFIEETFEF